MAVKYILLIFSVSCLITSSICLYGNSNNVSRRNGINPNCRLLSDCPEYLWLLRNKYDVPGMAFQEVLQYLQSQQCGFAGNHPKVKCPQVDVSMIEDAVQQDLQLQSRMGGAIAVNHGSKVKPCSGSISIIHYKRSGAPLEDMKSLKLKGRKYGNLRILNNDREVIRVQSEGNCCWRVNNKIHFTGTNQHIHSGYDGIPNINIKSVSRTSC